MIATPYPLTLQDLPGLLAVQRACYGEGYLESAEVYARRLVSPAQCSLVLERESRVCAYLAAYDSVAGQVTPLHGEFVPVAEPDTLYLHDLAVLPATDAEIVRTLRARCSCQSGTALRGAALAVRRWWRCKARKAFGNGMAMPYRPCRKRSSASDLLPMAKGRCTCSARYPGIDQRVIGRATPMAANAPPQIRLKRLP